MKQGMNTGREKKSQSQHASKESYQGEASGFITVTRNEKGRKASVDVSEKTIGEKHQPDFLQRGAKMMMIRRGFARG